LKFIDSNYFDKQSLNKTKSQTFKNVILFKSINSICLSVRWNSVRMQWTLETQESFKLIKIIKKFDFDCLFCIVYWQCLWFYLDT